MNLGIFIYIILSIIIEILFKYINKKKNIILIFNFLKKLILNKNQKINKCNTKDKQFKQIIILQKNLMLLLLNL